MKAVRDIISKLNYILNRKQKRQYFVVTFLAFIGSLLETAGTAIFFPFVSAIMTPGEYATKWYAQVIDQCFHPKDQMETIAILGGLVFSAILLKNIYLVFSSYVYTWYSTGVQRDLSIKMTHTYLNSSYLFHLGVNSAVLIRSINQDVVGVFGVFFYLFRVLSEVFTVGAISIFIIALDPLLAGSLVLILGTCMLILFFGLKRLVKLFGRIGQDCDSRMLQCLTQAFNGIKEIMVKNKQKYFAESFDAACTLSAKAAKRNNFLNVIPVNVYEVICMGGLIAVVIMRLQMTDNVAGFVTVLATVAYAAFRLFPATGRLTTNLNAIMYNRPRLDSIYEMLKQIEEDDTYQLRVADPEDAEPLGFEKNLEIKNVRWKYPAGQEDVLRNLSLEIRKGESVALIGPSGAGKTTLADVVLGLLKPQEGQILLDGVDVYQNLAGWAKIIGYVPQAVYLTDDTIRGNVAFGIYEKDIDDDKIWRALEEAQLAEFVRGLDKGLDTMVGERGVRLSGGQRQRIAIARALYEDPQILVLDEATSALDTETETAVMEAIDSLHGSKTMIIVAHRLTTIRNCDAIFEINGGVATKRDKAEVLEGIG